MFRRGVWVALGFLAPALASSAGAQGNLDEGKTAAQIYASACATCHKSPQSVPNSRWLFGLESFLRQHYTTSHESAAILAGYLKGQKKLSADSQRGRGATHASQANSPELMPSVFGDEIPRPPADIPDVKR